MTDEAKEYILFIDDLEEGGELEEEGGKRARFSGIKVTTNLQAIEMSMESDPQCCESFGYVWTSEKTSDFIGAEVLSIQATTVKITAVDSDEGRTMFVKITTDRGELMFTAYNLHNGYYSHMARVVSTKFNYETSL